jgi:hypothetical protein
VCVIIKAFVVVCGATGCASLSHCYTDLVVMGVPGLSVVEMRGLVWGIRRGGDWLGRVIVGLAYPVSEVGVTNLSYVK